MNLTQMTIVSTIVGKNPLEEMELALIVKKRAQNSVFVYNLKKERMISVCFQGKPFTIIIIQVYATSTNANEAEIKWFYDDLQEVL